MTKNLLNLPVADGGESATRRLIAGARKVLELATTNNERMATREKAERMKAAAEALGWREIATECSIIMMDAERLIVKSTDLKKPGPNAGADSSLDADQTTDDDGPEAEIIEPDKLDRQALYDMRRGHVRMTDAQYADLRDEARTSGSILTRKRVIDRAKQLNKGDEEAQGTGTETAPPPVTRKRPNTKALDAPEAPPATEGKKSPPVTSEASLRKRIADLEAQVETLEERCAILSESGDATTIEERFNNQAAVITAMRNENVTLQKRLDASELRCQLQADRIKELVEKYAVEEVDPQDRQGQREEMTVSLYPHQVDAHAKVRASMMSGNHRVMLCGPTGFGKTHVAGQVMASVVDRNKRCLFVADRRVLISQASKRLK